VTAASPQVNPMLVDFDEGDFFMFPLFSSFFSSNQPSDDLL
jgi:hypothetical protein